MNDVEVTGEESNGINGAVNAIRNQCNDNGYQDRRQVDSAPRYEQRSFYNNNYMSSNHGQQYNQPEVEDTFTPIDWDAANREAEEARRIRWSRCPTMIKNFYTEHPDVTQMTDEDVEKFREANKNIKVAHDLTKEDANKADEVMPRPVTKFHHAFEKYPDLMAEIQRAGFDTPSPIQSQMWPILLKGDDCIGIAQTGTGKTLGE